MIRRFLLATAALLTFAAGNAQAIDAIPQSCLVCRHAESDAEFVRCLYRCLDEKKGEIGLKPMPEDRPNMKRWQLKENRDAGYGKAIRTATLDADTSFRAFMDRVEPKLVLAMERNGSKRVFIDLNPAKVSPFEKPVVVRFDNDPASCVQVKAVWSNHALRLDDPDFYKKIRKARHLRITVETIGGKRETVHFDTTGIRRIIRWLDGHRD